MRTLKAGGDFIYTIVNSVNDLPDDPQMLANEYVVDYDHPAWGPIKVVGSPLILSRTPADPRGVAPEFGEHTEQVLIDLLGYSWDEVARLKEAQVI
jgi:crotonobetainyl-CoA:carnitine CoA-transferase CaiB-like acyl-CoA transferase